MRFLILFCALLAGSANAEWERSDKGDGTVLIQKLSEDNAAGLLVGCGITILALRFEQESMDVPALVAVKFDEGETYPLKGYVTGKLNWIVLSEFHRDLTPQMKKGNNVGFADGHDNIYWFSLKGFTKGYNSLGCT